MAARSENINGSRKASIIVSVLQSGPFSFPRHRNSSAKSSGIDLQ
jgi:hypothetical protein